MRLSVGEWSNMISRDSAQEERERECEQNGCTADWFSDRH